MTKKYKEESKNIPKIPFPEKMSDSVVSFLQTLLYVFVDKCNFA